MSTRTTYRVVPGGPVLPPARRHKPSCRPAWPRILVTGETHTQKSWEAAVLSADPRLGGMYWLEIGDGENTAEEYGVIEGARYEIIEHDGTYAQIHDQLAANWHEAKAVEDAGGLPIALTIDAMSGLHSMLQDMGDTRARRKLAQQLADAKQDPAAAWSSDREAVISNDLWNLIKKRHQRIMKWVLTWPGPVIMISRERMAVVYENDKPTKLKDWALECRKDLHFQATVWVRMHPNDTKPEVLKLRSGQRGRSIAVGNAKPIDRFNAAHVIFDVIGCESGASRAPTYRDLNADQVTAGDNPDGDHYRDAALAAAGNVDRLKALYTEVGSRGLLQTEVPGADGKPVALGVLIRDLGIAAAAAATSLGEPSAPAATAVAGVASDESGLVDMAQLQALRAALVTLGVREAAHHGLVATRLLGVAIPANNLRNLTESQAETLAILLSQDTAANDVAAALAEPAAA